MKPFNIYLITKVFSLIIVLQLGRAAIVYALFLIIKPESSNFLCNIIGIISFAIVLILFLLFSRSSFKDSGVSFKDISKKSKIVYIMLGAVYLLLLFSSLFIGKNLNIELFIENLHFALLVPVYEELIFRGYLWNKIQTNLQVNRRDLFTFIIVTLLFTVWHLGYFDWYLLRAIRFHPDITLASIMIGKMVIGLVFGVITGLLRWKTGKIYGGLLFHGIKNILGG